MTDRKAFIYTMVAFTILTLASYIANEQTQLLSFKQTISPALTDQRDSRLSELQVGRANYEMTSASNRTLQGTSPSSQLAPFSQAPVFFGFANNAGGGDKMPLSK